MNDFLQLMRERQENEVNDHIKRLREFANDSRLSIEFRRAALKNVIQKMQYVTSEAKTLRRMLKE